MKRKILAVFTLVILIALLAAGSYAYTVQSAPATSRITSGSVSIEVYTKGADGAELPADGQRILPGDTVQETVTVENTGSHPVWVRVSATPTVVGKPEISAEGCLILQGLDVKNWTQQGDWYYYNKPLEPGKTTEPLFTAVHFDEYKIDNTYLGEAFSLDITGAGVQTENNGTSALTAEGWPA